MEYIDHNIRETVHECANMTICGS